MYKDQNRVEMTMNMEKRKRKAQNSAINTLSSKV